MTAGLQFRSLVALELAQPLPLPLRHLKLILNLVGGQDPCVAITVVITSNPTSRVPDYQLCCASHFKEKNIAIKSIIQLKAKDGSVQYYIIEFQNYSDMANACTQCTANQLNCKVNQYSRVARTPLAVFSVLLENCLLIFRAHP